MKLVSLGMLFAQVKLREPKPGDWAFGWSTVGMIAGVSTAIVVVIWLISRWVQRRERTIANSPWHLFKDLCAAHELTPPERQMLTRLAGERDLAQPATLFVEPAHWGLDRGSSSGHTTELEKLKRRIFALR